ncbi:DUF3781 domain-containing protein [Filifactor alocis]|uniref:DUF3781 domain-containing protein n=1 Tax=Filifactor alocis TaxID=143361 RepID=UPI002F3EC3A9
MKRNLKFDVQDIVEYCKNKILNKDCLIYKQGKIWYCEAVGIKITFIQLHNHYRSQYQINT